MPQATLFRRLILQCLSPRQPRSGGRLRTALQVEPLEDRLNPSEFTGITGLFNSGVDASRTPITSGTDTHYTVVANGLNNSAYNGPAVFESAFSGVSAYIQPPGGAGSAITTFNYQTTFTLAPGYDPSTVMISGNTSVDDQLDNIVVNGHSTGDTTGSFTLTGNFVAGTNTLVFVAENTFASVTNFDVEFTAESAELLPPTLTAISPSSVLAGSGATTITVTGTNFISGSTVDVNGTAVSTTFISSTELTAIIPATDLQSAGMASVTVVNPAPGGGTTAALSLTVTHSYLNPAQGDQSGAFTGLTTQEHFIQQLYLDELGRAGSVAELDGYLHALNGHNGQAVVAREIADSPEGRDNLVKGWYQTYLGRAAVGGEELSHVNLLLQGSSEEAVLSGILGSAEFFANAQTLQTTGTAQERYVAELYSVLLNRTAGADEIAAHVSELSGGTTQAQEALNFLNSTEFRTDLVVLYYNVLLNRTATTSEVSGWLDTTLDASALRLMFEGSTEYYDQGTKVT
jgi:hypothetical protein